MKLAYNINKINKARYILLNFQANNEILDELANLIKFNDSIMRHMFLAQDEKITEPSVMMATRERA
jgi:ribosomal protein S6